MLSGSAHVGQLYDGKKDQIIHDRFLWSDISVNEANITSVQTRTYIEETIRERSTSMGVSASLSISLYSGLIEVSCFLQYIISELMSLLTHWSNVSKF